MMLSSSSMRSHNFLTQRGSGDFSNEASQALLFLVIYFLQKTKKMYAYLSSKVAHFTGSERSTSH